MCSTEEGVLAEGDDGRIVTQSYWRKFRVFMDRVDAADFHERTHMLVSGEQLSWDSGGARGGCFHERRHAGKGGGGAKAGEVVRGEVGQWGLGVSV